MSNKAKQTKTTEIQQTLEFVQNTEHRQAPASESAAATHTSLQDLLLLETAHKDPKIPSEGLSFQHCDFSRGLLL